MKNRKCPNRSHCWDYKSGNCDNCDLGDHILKLHKKIDRLKAKNKKLEAQSEWISVDDRLPEESRQYLTWHGFYYGIHDYSVEKQGWNILYCEDRETEVKTVTHWKPLPEPPKMKGGE